MTTPGNWTGGVPPGLGDTATFNGTATPPFVPSNAGTFSIGEINFLDTTPYTISNTGTISLSLGTLNSATQMQFINGSGAGSALNITGGSADIGNTGLITYQAANSSQIQLLAGSAGSAIFNVQSSGGITFSGTSDIKSAVTPAQINLSSGTLSVTTTGAGASTP